MTTRNQTKKRSKTKKKPAPEPTTKLQESLTIDFNARGDKVVLSMTIDAATASNLLDVFYWATVHAMNPGLAIQVKREA